MNDQWVGKIIGGCRLEKLIGKGGMGAVYLAHQLNLERKVAVKLLLANTFTISSSMNLIKRFHREAKLAAQLQHPNAVQVFDFGQQDNVHYIIMQLIEGINLEVICQRDGVFTVQEYMHVIKSVSKALSAAHQKGIIHRDIKPANILRRKDKSIIVADFGLAKPLNLTALSAPGDLLGTLGFMSPEQARGEEKIDHRTDIYSLGATIFYLATGHSPFQGENPVEVLYKQTISKPPDIQQYRQDIPLAVVKLITKMMECNPKKRFQKATELLTATRKIEKMLPYSRSHFGMGNIKLRSQGKIATQLLSRVLLPGEQKLAQRLPKYMGINNINPCQGEDCQQKWNIEQVSNKDAILFQNQIWCQECLWKKFEYTMAGCRIGKVEKLSFGDYWLALKNMEEFIPGSPIRFLYRFPLKREKKGWPVMLKRIERGFTLASKLHSNALMRCGSFVLAPQTNFAYVPIEYIPGLTLEQLLKELAIEKKKLQITESIALLRKLVQGLSALHENKIVHRNLTPKSIHISLKGGIRIGNFTMAKNFSSTANNAAFSQNSFQEYCQEYWEMKDFSTPSCSITTNINCVLGTVSYMSPEQTLGACNVDHHTDIWSWGIIAFEILEGKKPFPSNKLWSTVQAIREKALPDFSQATPMPLQKIIHRALTKKLDNRYHSASEIKKALDLIK